MQYQALHNRIHELAVDVGRLDRYIDRESSGHWILERVKDHVEVATLMLEPPAHQLAACYAPGCDQAIDEAILIVDARYRSLQQRLGRTPA